MSFILDALKKAEAERQRQTGPTLLEVRVTAPRRRLPLWTLIIGALLGLNIVLLLVFVLRRSSPNPVAPATAVAETPVAAAAPVAPAAPVSSAPAPAAAAPPPAVNTPATPVAPSAPASATRAGTGGDLALDNPADFEPAMPAARSTTRSEPPSLSEVGGDLPELRLDLHVYAARPADRYALINMHRVHEGDVLPEGPRVLSIDRDGVELSYRGTEFMLHPQ